MTREEQVSRAKSVLILVISRSLMVAGQTLWPVLFNFPIVGQLLQAGIEKLVTQAVNFGEIKAFALMIDERIDRQTKSFFDAAIAYDSVKNSEDKDVVRKAEDDFIRAADPFLNLAA